MPYKPLHQHRTRFQNVRCHHCTYCTNTPCQDTKPGINIDTQPSEFHPEKRRKPCNADAPLHVHVDLSVVTTLLGATAAGTAALRRGLTALATLLARLPLAASTTTTK